MYITEVGTKDVLCGKGKAIFDHVGNRRFRVVVCINMSTYSQQQTKSARTAIVRRVTEEVIGSGARFLKRSPDTDGWVMLNRDEARAKVSQTMRDAARDGDQGSSKRKAISAKKRQLQQQQQQHQQLLTSETKTGSASLVDFGFETDETRYLSSLATGMSTVPGAPIMPPTTSSLVSSRTGPIVSHASQQNNDGMIDWLESGSNISSMNSSGFSSLLQQTQIQNAASSHPYAVHLKDLERREFQQQLETQLQAQLQSQSNQKTSSGSTIPQTVMDKRPPNLFLLQALQHLVNPSSTNNGTSSMQHHQGPYNILSSGDAVIGV